MTVCHQCRQPLIPSARFCAFCGAARQELGDAETLDTLPAPPRGVPTPATKDSNPSKSGDRFAIGEVLGDRYRILALLGKGGMGEVYRAQDLRLEQEVALKFFSTSGISEAGVAERTRKLSAEVRLSREVTHPNVCRVHDLAEIDVPGDAPGSRVRAPVLSMEFVSGEDLAGLLRRIGRMPADKSVDIARQLCSGLAAAHAKGIIHRDLKPANVMIDAKGVAKITDFGLAGMASDVANSGKAAGTPLYMAPESLRLGQATEQSDLYSLGLVLHELITGKPVFAAASLKDLAEKQEQAILPPSAMVRDVDPQVERAIMRCLEREPSMRPSSALEVLSMLPGGDPLRAALAAGVTPSVATIAGATNLKSMRARTLGLAGLALVVLLGLVVWLMPRIQLLAQLPLEKPPAVLADRAREILKTLGYTPTLENSVYRFDVFDEYLDLIEQKESSIGMWDRLRLPRPGAMDFWYRQFPVPIRPEMSDGVVTWDDPRPIGGSISMRLDLLGQLRELRAVPDGAGDDLAAIDKLATGAASKPTAKPDPRPAFIAAGLDFDKFVPVTPARVPQVFGDLMLAWEGVYPESPETKVRVELAWFEGKLVSFRTLEPQFATTFKDLVANTPGRVQLAIMLEATLRVGSLLIAAVLAWVNFRYRRGDARGATRIAVFMGLLLVLSVLCRADVLSSSSASTFNLKRGAIGVIFSAIEGGLFLAVCVWIAYFALEPYARRFWPETLIAWSRLLLGRFNDPEVGRSAVIGVVAGCLVVVTHSFQHLCGPWIGSPTLRPMIDEATAISALLGVREIIGATSIHAVDACLYGMGLLLGIVLLSLLFRNRRFALAIYAALQMAVFGLSASNNALAWVFAALMTAIVMTVLLRYGLLALVVGAFVFKLCVSFPISTNTDAWYFNNGAFAIAIIAGMGIWGLFTASRAEVHRPYAKVT